MTRNALLLLLIMGFGACRTPKETVTTTTPPPRPLYPIPTARQLSWHEMEMYGFIHFTTNTFTGKEWGYGNESPAIFNPAGLDAEQWVRTFKEAGFKGVILTAKHHDGFCLWPSKYTAHSVKNSPWKEGRGDVVAELAQACKKQGLKLGIYLSPWDRNRADYGKPSYITYYRDQLRELFTGYGPLFEMWFDGANGGDGFYGGANEKRKINGATYYDWPNTLRLVRTWQPGVLFFSDAGPDIRWVGNERGIAGETNWNTISPDTLYAGKAGIEKLLNTGSVDGTAWIPAEVDVSIRKGWFYHPEEDTLVKSAAQLFQIYLTSVGRGSNLLLNVPPDQRGLLHERDVAALKGFKTLLEKTFKTNLAAGAAVVASNVRGGDQSYGAENLTDGKGETYWATDDSITHGWVELQLEKAVPLHYLVLQEYIALGQRVKRFTVEAWQAGSWREIAAATTIGYKRILPLQGIQTSKLRVHVREAKACPLLANMEVY